MMFVNMDVPVEQILDEYVNEDLDPSAKDVHVLITEDGRGLAGGIFMIRNSPQGMTTLRMFFVHWYYVSTFFSKYFSMFVILDSLFI